MEAPAPELELGVVDTVAAFDEAQGQAPGPQALGRLIEAEFGVEVGRVALLQRDGEAADLAAVEWGDPSTHLEGICTCSPGRTEPAGASDGAGQCAVAASPVPQPQRTGSLHQIEIEPFRVGIEFGGAAPQDHRR